MATTDSTTIKNKKAAAANAGKYIPDAHLVSGALHFQQAQFTIGGAGNVPLGATGDIVVLDFLPSGVALVPGMITVHGSAGMGPDGHSIYVHENLGQNDGSQVLVGIVQNNSAEDVVHLSSPPGSVAPSNKRRFIWIQQGGAFGSNGNIFVNIPGLRAE